MATVAISIVDRLIQLATVREKNREKYFRNFIEPLYLDGEVIAKDFLALMAELIHRIRQADKPREVVEWLEERRAAFQPLRVKVRALIEERFMVGGDRRESDAVVLFKNGLWGLMRGGASWAEDGHALTGDYGFGDHTVLDLLRRARNLHLQTDWRQVLTTHAVRQQRAMELAWKDVAKGYAMLKHLYLS